MLMTAVDRIPPQNLEAEQAILGSLLVERDLVPIVSEIVEKSDFYAPHHATVYDAIIALYERGEPIDKVSVSEELRRHKLLDEVGGVDLISQLLNTVSSWLLRMLSLSIDAAHCAAAPGSELLMR